MKNFFYKSGINLTHDKEMFEFLKHHFQYDVMNSWNNRKSIANNVKLYNLNLEGDSENALNALQDYGYEVISDMISEWEAQHSGYSVIFNGRSSGYLVLTKGIDNALPYYIDCYTYNTYKFYCKENYSSLAAARDQLVEVVKVVRDFDKLCDDIRDYVNELSKEDYIQNTIISAVDDFNYDFKEELEALDIEMLEVLDNHKIKVDQKLMKYKSLQLCLYRKLMQFKLKFDINTKNNIIEVTGKNC